MTQGRMTYSLEKPIYIIAQPLSLEQEEAEGIAVEEEMPKVRRLGSQQACHMTESKHSRFISLAQLLLVLEVV